jgi:hypothetical protein
MSELALTAITLDINDGKQKCNNCKCWREPSSFIGKKGLSVKTCMKCREKDAKQKKKPEVVETRKKRQNEKKYYIAHREKKRAENEEEFLKHNAEVVKAWRNENKEHCAKWQTNNFGARSRAIKYQAQKKGIMWNEYMSDDVCEKMMTSPCVYCGFISEETLNGIDRKDGQLGYSQDNCVSCCKNCNFIKKCLDPITFIQRCQHISGQAQHPEAWSDGKSMSYKSYQHRAEKKLLAFELSEMDYLELVSRNCVYCGKENTRIHMNGIDRDDNSIGYVSGNCVSCCKECNQMKADISGENFIQHCKRVSIVSSNMKHLYTNIPRCIHTIFKRHSS